jgi:hypothetical protein
MSGEQLDLFALMEQAKAERTEAPPAKLGGIPVVVSDAVAPGEVLLVGSDGRGGKAVNVGTPEEPSAAPDPPFVARYGDDYLAAGIARWSVFCFLWHRGTPVCAPYFGDQFDRGWRPRWVDRDTAEAMLRAAGYTQRSTRTDAAMPGGHGRGDAVVFQYPGPAERDRRRKLAASSGTDADLWDLPPRIGIDGPEADDLYNTLRALRRAAEKDDLYRRKNRGTDVR